MVIFGNYLVTFLQVILLLQLALRKPSYSSGCPGTDLLPAKPGLFCLQPERVPP